MAIDSMDLVTVILKSPDSPSWMVEAAKALLRTSPENARNQISFLKLAIEERFRMLEAQCDYDLS